MGTNLRIVGKCILYIVTFALVAASSVPASAQITWEHAFEGNSEDRINSMAVNWSGDIYMAGSTNSFGPVPGSAWIVKAAPFGGISWEKTLSLGKYNAAFNIFPTMDNGCIVAGDTQDDSPIGTFFVAKLVSWGQVEWLNTYSGISNAWAWSIVQTSDGGYLVTGPRDDMSATATFLLKLASDGSVLWAKTFEAGFFCGYRIIQTYDGGYLLGGWGIGGHQDMDGYLYKLDPQGETEWFNGYGGDDYDHIAAVRQTSDGGFILAGDTKSFGAGGADFWVLRVDSLGTLLWQKTYGGPGNDWALDVLPTEDGGFLVAGDTDSFGGGMYLLWMLKLDSMGGVIWQKTYGREGGGTFSSISQTQDGGILVAGNLWADGGNGSDFWIFKTDPNGTMDSTCPLASDTSVVAGQSYANRYNGLDSGTATEMAAHPEPFIDQPTFSTDRSICANTGCTLICGAEAPRQMLTRVPCAFLANPTVQSCGLQPTFAWSFGDGGESLDGNTMHGYTAAGRYEWTLTTTAAERSCTIGGTVQVIDPPSATLQKRSDPFQILATGGNLQQGIKVYINEVEWTQVEWKSPQKIVLKGGKHLKATVPKGVLRTFKLVNPDGGYLEFAWAWW